MVYRQRVDASAYSTVVVCDCGWRYLSAPGDPTTARARCWREAYAHAQLMHPGDNAETAQLMATRTAGSL